MKAIGFVDYYISEWHANNYPNWIKEISEKTGKDFQVKYAWAEEYVSPVDGVNTDEWCAKFGCEKCETIKELCEKCDYIIILSPSNPEKHIKYAAEVLKYKKNTYIDKTFAPDFNEAKGIFDIAEKYGTKFFSSSALRYAKEIKDFYNTVNVITYGGGGNIEEYIIHQIEMAVKLVDEKPLSLKMENQGNQYICRVKLENQKNITMVYAPSLPFAVCIENDKGESVYKVVESEFFKSLVEDMLRFFETGEGSFDSEQTLCVMKIRTGVIDAKKQLGQWIAL